MKKNRHHYEHVDHEIVYDICNVHIPKIDEVVQKMRESAIYFHRRI